MVKIYLLEHQGSNIIDGMPYQTFKVLGNSNEGVVGEELNFFDTAIYDWGNKTWKELRSGKKFQKYELFCQDNFISCRVKGIEIIQAGAIEFLNCDTILPDSFSLNEFEKKFLGAFRKYDFASKIHFEMLNEYFDKDGYLGINNYCPNIYHLLSVFFDNWKENSRLKEKITELDKELNLGKRERERERENFETLKLEKEKIIHQLEKNCTKKHNDLLEYKHAAEIKDQEIKNLEDNLKAINQLAEAELTEQQDQISENKNTIANYRNIITNLIQKKPKKQRLSNLRNSYLTEYQTSQRLKNDLTNCQALLDNLGREKKWITNPAYCRAICSPSSFRRIN
ncbi:MAG: hypothetical protein MRECE_8c049 [Mycoplasmataceae bacterium CE_OT135]|nr:MAG: hypothetical protein MRECE_8c049 [Mycoplasmataceae bacterium CE_OT135]